uniref:Uncharacterized protein n=1 Tax=Pithovirus LCDPAC01 TaxID=2506600 RepID=A0A481YNK0_9VIRU|nr:MAG: hypothetical protein LCDPAC01_00250 [Pithovirus LCDPAC01]
MERKTDTEFDSWRVKVKFISKLPRNHKLGTITNTYHPAGSWTAWIPRSYYGEGHVLADNYITSVFEIGKNFYEQRPKEREYIVEEIKSLTVSTQLLEEVYSSKKPEMSARMRVLKDKITSFCTNPSKYMEKSVPIKMDGKSCKFKCRSNSAPVSTVSLMSEGDDHDSDFQCDSPVISV